MIIIILAALALPLSVAGCAIGIIALRRGRRNARTLAAYLRVWELANRQPDPPDDGGRRHLRLVAAWVPLAAGGSWLIGRIRAHPAVTAIGTITSTAAILTGLVITAPHGAPTADIGLQPPQHHSRRSIRPSSASNQPTGHATAPRLPSSSSATRRTTDQTGPGTIASPIPAARPTRIPPIAPSTGTTTATATSSPSTATTTATTTTTATATPTGTASTATCIVINREIIIDLGGCLGLLLSD